MRGIHPNDFDGECQLIGLSGTSLCSVRRCYWLFSFYLPCSYRILPCRGAIAIARPKRLTCVLGNCVGKLHNTALGRSRLLSRYTGLSTCTLSDGKKTYKVRPFNTWDRHLPRAMGVDEALRMNQFAHRIRDI